MLLKKIAEDEVPFPRCSDYYKPDNYVPVTNTGKSIRV